MGDLLSLYPIVRECVRIVFVKKMRRFILHINKNIYFCIARGEKSLGQECVSCFIPYIEIANFKQRDEDNVTLILFVYHRVQPTLYLHGIYDSVGYLFLSSFLRWRLAMPDIR